jgi:DNA-binding MarR family transcriptional regulator
MDSSIIPLISLWEEFTSKNRKAGLKDFAQWLLQNETSKEVINLENSLSGAIHHQQPARDAGYDDSAKVMLLITRLQRFMQMKAKPIIRKLGFTKDHEYSMLTHIYLLKAPNKKELAQTMLLENTTAVEITNRFLRKGLIKEVADENDRRSTRISLTAAGEHTLLDSYSYMQQLPVTFLECLTLVEKKELLSLLQKVEQYQKVVI